MQTTQSRNLIYSLLLGFLVSTFSTTAFAQKTQKLTIQLSCKHRFKFAGFYMAQKLGLYEKEALQVQLVPLIPGSNPANAVLQGNADLALGTSAIILNRMQGAPVILLANFLKRSGSILIVKPNINSPQDLRGKKIMLSECDLNSNIGLMLKKNGIQKKDFHIVRHSHSMKEFIRGDVDAMSTCSSSNTYQLDKLKIRYNVINPSTYALYEHDLNLFTSEVKLKKNKEAIFKFVQATIQGWRYALDNVPETIDYIHLHYNPEKKDRDFFTNEAKNIKYLFLSELYPIGFVDLKQVEVIAQRLLEYGLIPSVQNLQGFISTQIQPEDAASSRQPLSLTAYEQKYLADKKTIRMCVDPDWLPFETIDSRGQHIGMAAEYIALINRQIHNRIRLVKTKTWQESILLAKERKCDIFSLAMSTQERLTYMNFTTPYLSFPFVIATREEELFVENLEQVIDKPLAGVKGYAFVEILKQRHPKLNIREVKNVEEGLELVQKKKIYGMIGTLPTIGYKIQSNAMYNIKIAGKFKDIWALGISVRNDDPILFSILQKGVDSITSEDHQRIRSKWLTIKYERSVDYSLIGKILSGVFILFLFIVFRYREVTKYNNQLKQLNAELARLSITDPLTGLSNRHRMDESLLTEIEKSRRHNCPFSVILLDIDHFKLVNDTHGHNTGDDVLQKFAGVLKSRTRKSDLICRWGGEEFLILCTETKCRDAQQFAESLREQIETYDFGIGKQITASFGVAQYSGQEKPEILIKHADDAMYFSKKQGRNHVTVHGEC